MNIETRVRTTIFAIILLLLSSCGVENKSELRIEILVPEIRDEFIANLRAEGIKHRETEDGVIWYPIHERERVQRIRDKVISTELTAFSVQYDDPKHTELLRSKLENQGIAYQAQFRRNKEYTTWSPVDDKEVQLAIDEVKQLIIETKRLEILEGRQ